MPGGIPGGRLLEKHVQAVRPESQGICLSEEGGDEAPAFRAQALHGGGALRVRLPAGAPCPLFAGIPASVPDAGGRALRNSADVPDYHEKQKQRMTGI